MFEHAFGTLGTDRTDRDRVGRARLLGAALGVGVALAGPVAAQPRDRAAPLDFQGRALVALSDADMEASAYVDGRLGPREGRDALSVIPLGRHPRDLQAHAVEVSNSVAGPPVALAVSPDGRFAVAVETFGQRPAQGEDHTFRDLRHGARAFVVDLGTPSAPRLVQTIDVPERPDSVSFSADGTLVALAINPAGGGARTPLALLPFAQGRLGAPVTPELPGWRTGERLIHAEFHPSQPILALVNETRGELSFVRVIAGPEPRLARWGNAVQVEKAPYMARFTPDGRHVLVNALYWGPDVQGTWNEAPRGGVVSVRLEAGPSADGEPRHAFVSRVTTGVSPEGLAVSPDGRLVATTNLERSYLPQNDERITWFSSITLASFDPATGTLRSLGDFAYDGILPEAAAFDASSRYLAVVTYDQFDDRRQGGAVDFWRVAQDPLEPARTLLVKTSHSVPVARGAHSMVLVR